MTINNQLTGLTNLTQIQYRVAEDILFRQVENEGILLHIPNGTYYSLSETSILFWEALSKSQSLVPVIEQISNEYEVELDILLEDLQNLLQDLLTCGLIAPISN
jgi:Coenzyme PQQ synthesis protein D (PqqD)